MSLQIEVLRTKGPWNSVLNQFRSFDFVHTFDFHEISQNNGEGAPVIFVVRNEQGRCLACWPALQRDIPETDRFDLTSVYGYGGPLVSQEASADEIKVAFDFIFESMKNAGAVSLFSRMHPIFIRDLPAGDLRGVDLGGVVVMDIVATKDLLAGYRPGHRYDIRRALKNGVEIEVDLFCQGLDDFLSIYQQAMRDLDAPGYYLFNDKYFLGMKNASDYRAFILFGKYNGKRIAAAMFVVTKNVMQYYLSGSLSEFRKLAASKAIIARAHEMALAFGVEHIVLGGGVGSKADPLFDFKKGFSRRVERFHIFKRVIDPIAYLDICKAKGFDASQDGFFPAYRAVLDGNMFAGSRSARPGSS